MRNKLSSFLTYFIAVVWLVNGLYCKILGYVPRHQQIVARILGESNSGWITRSIGVMEVIMSIWVLSGRQRRINAAVQILLVMTMNLMEFFLARDLLLFGGMNIVVAGLFCIVLAFWGGRRSGQDAPSI